MWRSLYAKFFFILIIISVIALTGTFIIERLLIRDFENYLEGEMEDRVYIVIAGIEEIYRKSLSWEKRELSGEILRALMIGIDVTLRDNNGELIIDSHKSLEMVSPEMRRKVTSMVDLTYLNKEPINYPLFFKGDEIGSIDVRFLKPVRESVFKKRAKNFILILIPLLGGISIIFSLLMIVKVTAPLKRLTDIAERVSKGDLTERLNIKSDDEIGKLARTFNMMLDNLLTHESLRKRLITNVAHELRTPLTTLRSEIEAMMDGVNPVDIDGLKGIYNEVVRLRKIIDGIEEYTSAQASRVSLKRERIKLREFIEPIMERYRRLYNNLNIVLNCDDTIVVNADPERLGQIIINLIDNAVKSMNFVAEPRLSINAGYRDSETFIEISDNGCGISGEDLPFIFERFYRRFENGLGLGLSIVKELIDAHNGRIEVRSDYKKGSTFTIYIPDL